MPPTGGTAQTGARSDTSAVAISPFHPLNIYIYPGKGFGSFGIARGPDPDSPGPGGAGAGVPRTGSGIPAMFEATIADKLRYDRLPNRMIASNSP